MLISLSDVILSDQPEVAIYGAQNALIALNLHLSAPIFILLFERD